MSRIALSLSVVSVVLLASACGSDGSSFGGSIPPATFVVTNPGTGEPNALPLDPLVTGTRTGLRTVVGPTANGLIEVAYTLDEVYAEAGERFQRSLLCRGGRHHLLRAQRVDTGHDHRRRRRELCAVPAAFVGHHHRRRDRRR